MSNDKFTPKGEEEVRADVISKHSLDEATQGDLITSLTESAMESQKALGTAITQKQKYRDDLGDMKRGKDHYKEIANKPGENKPETKPETKPESNKQNEDRKLSDEDLIFLASEGTKEELKQLKTIMKSKGTSLEDAQKEPMYQAWKQEKDKKEKSDKAGLDPSTGSAKKKVKKQGDMTRDEHKKHFEKRVDVKPNPKVMPGM